MKHSQFLLFLSALFFSTSMAQGQCVGFPPTVAAADCGTYPSLYNNVSVEPGQIYGLCHSDNTFHNYTGVNLNGGMVRVCANATLSGNWNSGIIVVECGATLSFPSGLLMNNNIGIINYGTVEVTGTMEFQNIGNYFYNESDSARLLVSGNIRTPQNTNQTAYIKNNGFISVGGTFNCLSGCFMCLGGRSQIVTNRFQYMQNCGNPTNRITRPDNTNTAVIRYGSQIVLNAVPTANPTVQFWRQTGATNTFSGCGNFGAATVVNNAPSIPVRPAPSLWSCEVQNCRTLTIILPVELSYFNAEVDEKTSFVELSWETITEQFSDYFEVMRSTDGFNWEPIGIVKAAGHSTEVQNYELIDRYPHNGISYYRLDQYDFDGQLNSSGIRSVSTNTSNPISVYPNPAKEFIYVNSVSPTNAVRIYSLTGELLISLEEEQSFKNAQIAISTLAAGMYYLKTDNASVLIHKAQ